MVCSVARGLLTPVTAAVWNIIATCYEDQVRLKLVCSPDTIVRCMRNLQCP